MSNEPSGAIDHTFDESEEDARDRIEEALSKFNRDPMPGDVVIDKVKQRPLYVRRVVADTAVEYLDQEDFDLTTYDAHPWLGITAMDTIFECVFLPTKVEDIPSSKGDKTYAYPRGRLVRVPVEYLWNSDTRIQDSNRNFADRVAVVTEIFDAATSQDSDGRLAPVVDDAAREAFGEQVVEDAKERAGIVEQSGVDDFGDDEPDGEGDADTDDGLGDFDDYDGEE